MSDGGWTTVFPRPRREPVSGEVELLGGPRDGERRIVADIDEPLILDAFRDMKHVYRRRPVKPDEPERMPYWFDYQPPIPV